MAKQVLILGGLGRIGNSVAQDLLQYTDAEITVTSRQIKTQTSGSKRLHPLELDLDNQEQLRGAIAKANVVVHCAGPFHYRDGRVLKTCIEEGVDYVDVSDHRSFLQKVIKYRQEAVNAGVTAVLNTGIFPGISNSMVRQGVEQLDTIETIHLSYVVAGSGGAGKTVMRTTFLGLREAFDAWLDGKWQRVLPYSDREVKEFPKYGKTGVYWFDMPETYTFAESFPAKNIITKFGSVPDLYNHLTWITAHIFPSAWIESPKGIEFFSRVSYAMTKVTDKFSGIGVAMVSEISGEKGGKRAKFCANFTHESTAVAAGMGTGSVVELLLQGRLNKPGIWPVEQVLNTDLFLETLHGRGASIDVKTI